MIKCNYKENNNNCQILQYLKNANGFHIPDRWCLSRCNPDSTSAKINMLKIFGIAVDIPPDGIDLLEYLKDKIASGEIKIEKKPTISPEERQKQQEAERAELEAVVVKLKMPNPAQLILNLGHHLLKIRAFKKQTGRVYVTDEWKAERIAACEPCPKRLQVGDDFRCKTCGCYVKDGVPILGGKADYEALTCDLWKPIDDKWREKLGLTT